MSLIPGKRSVLEVVRAVLLEQCPDVRVDIPTDYLKTLPTVEILGRLDGVLLTIAHQLMFHYNAAVNMTNTVSGEFQAGELDLSQVMPKVAAGNHGRAVVETLRGIMWAGIFHDMPVTQSISGGFAIYRDWNVSIVRDQKVTFGRPLFDRHELGHMFYPTISRILKGQHVFDGDYRSPGTDVPGLQLVGRLESGVAQQLCLLSAKLRMVLSELDPWPTIQGEHVHFMSRPFEEYARFYHRRVRLQQYNDMMSNLIVALTFEAMDEDRLPERTANAEGVMQVDLYIMDNWNIYMRKAEE